MSDNIISITIPERSLEVIRRMRDFTGLGQAIAGGLDFVNQRVVGNIKQRISGLGVRRGHLKKQGANIGVDTGRLKQSIGRTDALVVGSADNVEVRSSVGSNVQFGADSVEYASIHEEGGRIQRQARSARLHFVEGKFVSKKTFMKAVRGRDFWESFSRKTVYQKAHTIEIPARPYVRPEIEAAVQRGDYSRAIDQRITRWGNRGGAA